MTSWRDKFRKASFRGIEFHIQNVVDEGGRQLAEHFFPTRETHLQEDLGRKSRNFNLSGFIIGDDYFSARDALENACSGVGAGQLIHPYKGVLQVVCKNYRITQSIDKGRMARFEMSFIEVGSQDSQPFKTSINSKSRVVSSSKSLLNTAKEAFKTSFNISSVPSFVQNSADINIDKLVSTFQNAAGLTSGSNPARAEFLREVNNFSSLKSQLLNNPSDLADKVQGLVSLLGETGVNSQQNIEMITSLLGFKGGLQPVIITTASRQVEANNHNSLINLVNNTTIAHKAVATSNLTFDSAQAATSARDELSDLISAEMGIAATQGADQSYLDLQDLKTASVRDLTDRAAQLPRIVEMCIPNTQPAFSLAHQLYAETPAKIQTMANDIIARNDLPNGGFVTGGQCLEVLSNV